ncbi:MAG: hypothetical protein II243_03335 [Lachnospiraceae bacterium]|nr:hypothetical protein [Lachnospiraceae bacterium]
MTKKRNIKKKENISPEERIYRNATGLMDAMDCVYRFERKVYSLRSAAKKFEKIPGYKDADELKEKCTADAETAKIEGSKEVFEKALLKKEKAVTKSDYVDVIEDFKRAKKFEHQPDECNKNIEDCKKKIAKIETISVYKRRIITITVIAFLIVGFMQTPLYPLVKGLYWQSKGEYYIALDYYAKSNYVLNGSGQAKECYYDIAEGQVKEGKLKAALKNYKNAKNKFDARKKAADIEVKLISQASVGDKVTYGKKNWIVLSLDNNKALLLEKNAVKFKAFDESGKNDWRKSSLRKWLNDTRLKKVFTKEERVRMLEQDVLNSNLDKPQERVSILDEFYYKEYKDVIPETANAYWLKHSGILAEDMAGYVTKDGTVSGRKTDIADEIAVRCTILVDLSGDEKK